MLACDPCILAAGRDYYIIVLTNTAAEVCTECGGSIWKQVGGIANTRIHKFRLPMMVLDSCKGYQIDCISLTDGSGSTKSYRFESAGMKDRLKLLYISDTHTMFEEPIKAAACAGKVDAVIWGGDFCRKMESETDILQVFCLCGAVTGGRVPTVFAMGNHDYRGKCALQYADYLKSPAGKNYFTFRMGSLWGVALDSGEDIADAEMVQGEAVFCHNMRMEQVGFLENVLAEKDTEFDAEGVLTRIAICHEPVSTALLADIGEKYDIEKVIYEKWTKLLNGMKLDFMLCGHIHTISVTLPDSKKARYGMNFPVIEGSEFVRPSGRNPDVKKSFRTVMLDIKQQIEIRTADSTGVIDMIMQINRLNK